ncbi:aspartyl/glutamyl-tRNA amidotransferase subunit C [candidate division WOR-3 bacterium]|nr:aspartyl/glutamyl-tRNA amidotransferase subunit C [candidate division WOR-3 bacterium]
MSVGKQIVKVADLARLDLTEKETERFGAEFDKILAYFSELQEMKMEGEILLPYPCPRAPDDPSSCDIDIEGLSRHLKEGYFLIPPWLA